VRGELGKEVVRIRELLLHLLDFEIGGDALRAESRRQKAEIGQQHGDRAEAEHFCFLLSAF
jgi:hypothetical protein